MKNALLIIGGLVLLALLLTVFTDSRDKSANKEPVEAPTEKTDLSPIIEKTKEQLLFEDLKKEKESALNYDPSIYGKMGAEESIKTRLLLFENWSALIERARQTGIDSISQLAEELTSEVKKIQISEYPKLREGYKNLLFVDMWMENIEVELLGRNYTTIQFTGGVFADNRTKYETYSTLQDMLTRLRFKRINLKWYEYDDEYTYWDIKSKDDSEI